MLASLNSHLTLKQFSQIQSKFRFRNRNITTILQSKGGIQSTKESSRYFLHQKEYFLVEFELNLIKLLIPSTDFRYEYFLDILSLSIPPIGCHQKKYEKYLIFDEVDPFQFYQVACEDTETMVSVSTFNESFLFWSGPSQYSYCYKRYY